MNRAFGFVEVIGMASAVVAVDTALKAANVTLEGLEPAKGQGMHTLKLAGNVGAVNAAVSAILGNFELANKVWSHTVIARPSIGLDVMIQGQDDVMEKDTLDVPAEDQSEKDKEAEKTKDEHEELIEDDASKEEDTTSTDEAPYEDDDLDENIDEGEGGESSANRTEESPETRIEEESPESPIKEEEEIPVEPSPLEPIKETALKSKSSENEEDLLEDENYTCNLCKDQACPRVKGEPRVKCIHYKEKE